MKHIKTFENLDYIERENILSSVCLYFENIIPISEEEGFIECLFDNDDGEYFTFYFHYWTDEDVDDRFKKFIRNLGLKIKEEKVTMQNVQIDVKVSNAKIKEYANLYNNITKYNI
jgi:D-mannonate dehydratase